MLNVFGGYLCTVWGNKVTDPITLQTDAIADGARIGHLGLFHLHHPPSSHCRYPLALLILQIYDWLLRVRSLSRHERHLIEMVFYFILFFTTSLSFSTKHERLSDDEVPQSRGQYAVRHRQLWRVSGHVIEKVDESRYLGTIVAFGTSDPINDHFGWRWVFYSSGIAGIAWCVLWTVFSTSAPQGSNLSHDDQSSPSMTSS